MTLSLSALFVIFAAVIGSASMVGVIVYLLHRVRQVEGGTTGAVGAHELADQLDRIRDEMLTVQNEVSALSERLDFTEKLLMRGGEAARPDGPE